jgi:methionyl aminopeptidase
VVRKRVMPGMTTKDLAEIAKTELRSTGGLPSFLGFQGFPDVICISINDEVVHGIPSHLKVVNEGDIITFDFGVTFRSMITDAAITTIVGKPLKQSHVKLLRDTKASLMAGIDVLHSGITTGDIGAAVQKVLDAGKYGIVRDLVGHGVGHYVHETPNIPNYGHKGSGPSLSAGMTIAIEPMATLGDYRVTLGDDNWTFRSSDGSYSAHFEHTVLITDDGYEILTKV